MNTKTDHFDVLSQEFELFGCADPMGRRKKSGLDSPNIVVTEPYSRENDPQGRGPEWVVVDGLMYYPGDKKYEEACEVYNLQPVEDRLAS
jgi:hypothetical protein